MIAWPDTLELTIDSIAQGGDGVGRWEGRVVFVTGGLPGEQVQVQVQERHTAYARGALIDYQQASPDRVPPRLPSTDSMPWQHIAYPAQLRFKHQIVTEQLAKIGGLNNMPIAETLPAAREWGYRSTAHFHSDGVQVGYYAADSHSIQDIPADPLLLPVLNEVLAALRSTIATSRWAMPPGTYEIVLRASETYGYTLAAIRGPSDSRALADIWRARCASLAGVVMRAPAPAPHIAQVGADHLIEEVDEIAFHLSPTTFFQVNRTAAQTLLGLVRQGLALDHTDTLLDLYCGAGTFTLPLAGMVDSVLGIEEHAGAISDAQKTAELHGITNVRFVVGRVESVLATLNQPVAGVVLDPPRRGCHPLALRELLRLAPPRLVYVSCHPATLARDLKVLVGGGYRVASIQPIDLFPQTPHIESVSVLERP